VFGLFQREKGGEGLTSKMCHGHSRKRDSLKKRAKTYEHVRPIHLRKGEKRMDHSVRYLVGCCANRHDLPYREDKEEEDYGEREITGSTS